MSYIWTFLICDLKYIKENLKEKQHNPFVDAAAEVFLRANVTHLDRN